MRVNDAIRLAKNNRSIMDLQEQFSGNVCLLARSNTQATGQCACALVLYVRVLVSALSLTKCAVMLCTTVRAIVQQGTMTKVGRRKNQTYMFVLFNDMLVSGRLDSLCLVSVTR